MKFLALVLSIVAATFLMDCIKIWANLIRFKRCERSFAESHLKFTLASMRGSVSQMQMYNDQCDAAVQEMRKLNQNLETIK